MWKELIGGLYDDAEFAPPASDEEIDQIERRLGQTVPDDLRELLRQTDGVRADYGSGLVWSVREIVEENVRFRQDTGFAGRWVAGSLEDYLRRRAASGGDDWYA